MMRICKISISQKMRLDQVMMLFGIPFQEYHIKGKSASWSKANRARLSMLRILWVAMSFLLAVSYNSNLKANLIRTEHEELVETMDQLMEQDFTIWVLSSIVDYAKANSVLPRDRRLFEHVTKKGSIHFARY